MDNATRGFKEIFNNTRLSPNLAESFNDTRVEAITLSRKTKKLSFDLISENIINAAQISLLETELTGILIGDGGRPSAAAQRAVAEAGVDIDASDARTSADADADVDVGVGVDIDVHCRYETKTTALEDLVSLYRDNLLTEIKQISPICHMLIDESECDIHNNTIAYTVKNHSASYLKKKGIDKYIASRFKESFSLDYDVKVVFRNDASKSEQSQDAREEEERVIREMLLDNVTPTLTQSSNTEDAPPLTNQLLGKPITKDAIKITDANEEGAFVVIEGDVLSVEARELKSGDKYIVSCDITDYTDSTTFKFFIKSDKFSKEISNRLTVGKRVKISGEVQFDKYARELCIMAKDIILTAPAPKRMDNAETKRIELHLHTQMSSMDGISSIKSYVQRAGEWGHKAIAVTDHGVLQSYPAAMDAGKKYGVKILYGVEAYIVDDLGAVVQCPAQQTLDDTFVVFDIETTGLSPEKDRIIEIGAVKIKAGQVIGEYSTFVDPKIPLPQKIISLTGITDEMLVGARAISEVLPEFISFCEDSVLVAHNASFDVGFMRIAAAQLRIEAFSNTVLDTVELSRSLFPQLAKHKLNLVAEHLGIELDNHHRAVDDATATAKIFIKCCEILADKGIRFISEINLLASKSIDIKKLKTYHAIIFVQNKTGLRNLYELVSKSHLDYFYRRPRLPKSEFMKLRDGLILGSACEAGEIYKAYLGNSPAEYIRQLAEFYDYFEIQPIGNNMFLVDSERVPDVDGLKEINKKIVALGKQFNKPVVATCDVHFLDPGDAAYRRIVMAAEGFSDADNQAPLYLRTTDEMLKEFSYLGDDTAYEIVVKNTNLIADMLEDIKPIPDETFPPKIEGAEEEIRRLATEKAESIYGTPLPTVVEARLDKELNSIIKNGFSVMYIIAQKLVWKSMEDGYLVGSRGSVGSSFVATMAGITEVNPLPPHYVCPKCRYSDFTSEAVISFAGSSGCDMPDKSCPDCGTKLHKDGHDIPFETFLGFDGDKEPDIDLNFSGDYQQTAHSYTEELFGEGFVFKAGTIGTLADKTAYGFVKKYMDERERTVHNAEINRLIAGCTGIKRTTGQHPGGLMVVPSDHSIYEFCPIQRPANDTKSKIITTHFDYHSIQGRLLKLDLLGHDDPTVIKMLEDLTGIDAKKISLDDKRTMSLFTSPNELELSSDEINCETGSLGLPEFGTKFVRQMLVDTQPSTFSELIRISGLSHGTDVWLNNAQDLVRNGTAQLKDVICTRDDIMTYLMLKGMNSKKAFKIMENVRKGKGLSDEDEKDMLAAKVPKWYIQSCKRIKYMFPKAHAAAYVMMAFRIAYFKVHYPEAFYASYFTVRADDFDYESMCKGPNVVRRHIHELESRGNLTAKEKSKLTILEIALEMYARNLKFAPMDMYQADAKRFTITPDGIMPAFNSVQGLGITAAESIVAARKDGEFYSIEDFRTRTGVSRTVIELLKSNNILTGLPETSQLSLF